MSSAKSRAGRGTVVYQIAIVAAFFVGMNLGNLLGTGKLFGRTYLNSQRATQTTNSSFGNAESLSVVENVNTNNNDDGDDPVQILYAISGGATDHLDEFFSAMKSTLLNNPLDRGMAIHILADQIAYKALGDRFNETAIDQWITRNPIFIKTYNIEHRKREWKEVIEKATTMRVSTRHTIGAFFRLFAYEFLPQDVEHVLYMDTDAGVTANLQELWRLRNSSTMFQWGESQCSGFVLFHYPRMEELFWKLVNETYHKDKNVTKEVIVQGEIDDQAILRVLTKKYPHRVSFLPSAWDLHRSDNLWRWKGNGDVLLENRPQSGMIHINGWDKSESKNKFQNQYPQYGTTLSALFYYGNHPWTWTRYILQTQVRDGQPGFQIYLEYNAT